jgi:hypothetical protein
VNGGILQSALRELKLFAASRNFWLTFGAIVLLFAVTGPFGTEELRFLPRLVYWFIIHAAAWSVAVVCVILGDLLLAGVVATMFWRIMAGSLAAAIPIGVVIEAVTWSWFGHVPTMGGLGATIAQTLPLSAIFCVISYLAMSGKELGSEDKPAASETVPEEEPSAAQLAAPEIPLLSRLKAENRGRLQHLSVEDHYTLVRTSRGQELILLRFSDALRETGNAAGLQVHRSHWVADDFVAKVNRADGRLSLTLADGKEIPVSRTHATDVRARFG